MSNYRCCPSARSPPFPSRCSARQRPHSEPLLLMDQLLYRSTSLRSAGLLLGTSTLLREKHLHLYRLLLRDQLLRRSPNPRLPPPCLPRAPEVSASPTAEAAPRAAWCNTAAKYSG